MIALAASDGTEAGPRLRRKPSSEPSRTAFLISWGSTQASLPLATRLLTMRGVNSEGGDVIPECEDLCGHDPVESVLDRCGRPSRRASLWA